MRTRMAICAVFAMSITNAFPNTIRVPQDQPTIQQGIDAAQSGDTVLVSPGTYLENINFFGKAITVKSLGGSAVTVIDGGNPTNPNRAAVVTFESGETWDSVLEGFAIVNGGGNVFGYTSERGGGIDCTNSSPVIRHNIIHGNHVANVHGGVAIGGGICSNASARIEYNIVHSNISFGYAAGGGIYCSGNTVVMHNIIRDNSSDLGGGVYSDGSAIVANNTLHDNYAYSSGSGIEGKGSSVIRNNVLFNHASSPTVFRGTITVASCTVENNLIFMNLVRGIACTGSPQITNNTVFGNSESGIWCWSYASPSISNSILWQNGSLEIELDDPGNPPIVSHCDVMGGWPGTGNIDADPLFADPAAADLHLLYPSPCRNTGDDGAVTELVDFEGDPRNAGGQVDMGADEFYRHLYQTGDATPGGTIQLKFVGNPGTAQVALVLGLALRDPPLSTNYGVLHVASPFIYLPGLGPIPGNGIYVLPAQFSATAPAPISVYLQALIGNELSNLCEVNVE